MEKELTQEQKDKILHHFREAARARALQWDHEAEIEKILGYEIDVDMQEYAAGFDDANRDGGEWLTWGDIEADLEEA